MPTLRLVGASTIVRRSRARVAVALAHCLFCAAQFESVDASMTHMRQAHGFFVPRPRRLTDLAALLTATGRMIGKRRQCVWCWKTHWSLKAVQVCQLWAD